jgi:hypothetical protein
MAKRTQLARQIGVAAHKIVEVGWCAGLPELGADEKVFTFSGGILRQILSDTVARFTFVVIYLRRVEVQVLRETVGSLADWLRQLANGVDDRPVVPNREAKSSGSENTYPEDLTDLDTIRAEIAEMASHSIVWLTRRQRIARTVTIKVRYDDFTTITRSHSAAPTRDESDLTARAVRLLDKTDARILLTFNIPKRLVLRQGARVAVQNTVTGAANAIRAVRAGKDKASSTNPTAPNRKAGAALKEISTCRGRRRAWPAPP